MSLEFRHIAHSYGGSPALEDVSLSAPAGEITCLLGSSGCGKSTLLNLAAGLLAVQQGTIHVGGEMLAEASFNPPPEKRPVGLMFQDGALFPHMTVAQNVGFGLSGSDEVAVEAWLEQVGLAGMGERYPHQLSGGQQQRAALARAMAAEPDVLLMDEPFASVDVVLRRTLRRECRAILRGRGATVLMVTHDPEEALDIGDRIAVMEAGRIVQTGTPQELYDQPASARVGSIFHGAQIIPAERTGDLLTTGFGRWRTSAISGSVPAEGECELLLRPECFDVAPPASEETTALTLRDVRHLGATRQLVFANAKGAEIMIDDHKVSDLHLGSSYLVTPQAASLLAFSKE